MRDMNYEWCFEGGCTYNNDIGDTPDVEQALEELEAMYREFCIAMAD